VFENRVMRIFETKREEEAGGWRRLHNEELHNFVSPNIIRVIKSRRIKWIGHVSWMEEMRNVYNSLVGKTEKERPLGRNSCRWYNNIGMDIKEIWWEGVDWIHQVQERVQMWALVNTVMSLRVP
jgi:hypothetical protein